MRIGDMKLKKVDAIKEADVYIGLAEPAGNSTIPMSVGVYKQIGGPLEVTYTWDEVVLILDGPLEITLNGVKSIHNAGDVALLKKGTHMVMNAPTGSSGLFITLPHLEEALKGTPLEGIL